MDRELTATCELTLALNIGPDGEGPIPHADSVRQALEKVLGDNTEFSLPGGTVAYIAYGDVANLEITVE